MRLPFSIFSLFLLLRLDILRAEDVEIVTEEPTVAPSIIYNQAQSPNASPFGEYSSFHTSIVVHWQSLAATSS